MPSLVLRSRSHQVLWLIATGACLAFIGGLLYVASQVSHPAQQYLASAVFAGLALVSLRFAFARVVFDYSARRLIVRNPFRTHHVGFDDIVRFDLRRSWIPNTYRNNRRLLVLQRKEGSRLTLIGVCALGTGYLTRMREQVDSAWAAAH